MNIRTAIGFSDTPESKINTDTVIFYTGGSYNPPHPMHVEAFLGRVRQELKANPDKYQGKKVELYMFPAHQSYIAYKCKDRNRPVLPDAARIEMLQNLLQTSIEKNPLPINVSAHVDSSECDALNFTQHHQVYLYLKNKFDNVNYLAGQDLYENCCKNYCCTLIEKDPKDRLFIIPRKGYAGKNADDSISSSKIIGLKGELSPQEAKNFEENYKYISLLSHITKKYHNDIQFLDNCNFLQVIKKYDGYIENLTNITTTLQTEISNNTALPIKTPKKIPQKIYENLYQEQEEKRPWYKSGYFILALSILFAPFAAIFYYFWQTSRKQEPIQKMVLSPQELSQIRFNRQTFKKAAGIKPDLNPSVTKDASTKKETHYMHRSKYERIVFFQKPQLLVTEELKNWLETSKNETKAFSPTL